MLLLVVACCCVLLHVVAVISCSHTSNSVAVIRATTRTNMCRVTRRHQQTQPQSKSQPMRPYSISKRLKHKRKQVLEMPRVQQWATHLAKAHLSEVSSHLASSSSPSSSMGVCSLSASSSLRHYEVSEDTLRHLKTP